VGKILIFILTVTLVALVSLSITSAIAHQFVDATATMVDYTDYYTDYPPDVSSSTKGVLEQKWHRITPDQVVSWRYNTGPFDEIQWWSGNAGQGKLVYGVHGIVYTAPLDNTVWYFSPKYAHYHKPVTIPVERYPPRLPDSYMSCRPSFMLGAQSLAEMGHAAIPPGQLRANPQASLSCAPVPTPTSDLGNP